MPMSKVKTILISGGSQGIGLELCKYYSAKGFQVITCSRGDRGDLPENVIHYQVDLSVEAEILDFVGKLKGSNYKIDGLINNAAQANFNFMITTSTAGVKQMVDVNFTGLFILTREISKMMIANRFGRVINMSSTSLPLHMPLQSVYASSKAAVEEFSLIISKELAPHNITVNILGCNPIETRLIKGIPEENINYAISRQSIPRLGQMQDVFNCIDFFLDEKSSFITGQKLYLGGVF